MARSKRDGVRAVSAATLLNDHTPYDAGKNTLKKWKNSLCVPRVTV